MKIYRKEAYRVKDLAVSVEGKEIVITNHEKLLWPEAGISKWQYIIYLMEVSAFLTAYTKDRMLMIWRYPEGAGGRRFEERSLHRAAPDWVARVNYKEKQRILLNDAATLVWIANLDALELHVPFDTYLKKDFPTELVLDLDPPDGNSFELAAEVALQVRDLLDSLSLSSVPKTSGATGIQIFVPVKPDFRYEDVRLVNRFLAEYLQQKLPGKITLDRVVRRRGRKLYLDYLQLWRGRTMAAPYSVRATPSATVSAPILWSELEHGVKPGDFTIFTVPERLKQKGDLFMPVATDKPRHENSLQEIIEFVKARQLI
jgi:bifunctional non-homologous end joining protein LigD